MIVHLASNGSVSVVDPDDFRRFKVEIDAPHGDLQTARRGFGEMVAFESKRQAWVSAGHLLRLAGPRDADWDREFARMIEAARPHGWVRDDPLRIAAHVEWISA
ncbi:hypothetical protein EN943_33420 [Mesorhizobium sp. M7A.F.Ca.US.006.01.1.1]|uniref:hypothetical protein n=1 Tax=Mesorhizobium sp. M7A.F.Ca.US.006.01.1.1 TaxID=2496707 RepID=UPI000FC9CB60|nr:hypothetical protein [Mesorhizobium sp. M7A.F.Ca.US.006.01.1.1]RUZ71538.1 hypothetical protein EN943_33420 [Mesorhizobium sp. M7A.F.Ca.US.006.01.1.1]